jgi:hypothetical protein
LFIELADDYARSSHADVHAEQYRNSHCDVDQLLDDYHGRHCDGAERAVWRKRHLRHGDVDDRDNCRNLQRHADRHAEHRNGGLDER